MANIQKYYPVARDFVNNVLNDTEANYSLQQVDIEQQVKFDKLNVNDIRLLILFYEFIHNHRHEIKYVPQNKYYQFNLDLNKLCRLFYGRSVKLSRSHYRSIAQYLKDLQHKEILLKITHYKINEKSKKPQRLERSKKTALIYREEYNEVLYTATHKGEVKEYEKTIFSIKINAEILQFLQTDRDKILLPMQFNEKLMQVKKRITHQEIMFLLNICRIKAGKNGKKHHATYNNHLDTLISMLNLDAERLKYGKRHIETKLYKMAKIALKLGLIKGMEIQNELIRYTF